MNNSNHTVLYEPLPEQPAITSSNGMPSHEIYEIINHRPHWLIRNGNILFLVIGVLLLGLTWLLKYPDIIRASVRLVAVNSPKLLTAKVEGKLEQLLVRNEEIVKKGQHLAFLQSTAHHEQVLSLREWVYKIESAIDEDHLSALTDISIPACNNLGEMQVPYQEFCRSLHETVQVLTNGYYLRKEKHLQQSLQYLSAQQKKIARQQQLIKTDLSMQHQEFKVREMLAGEKVIAPMELNQDKSKLLGKEQTLEQIDILLINNEMAELSKQQEILELQKLITDRRQLFMLDLLNLKSRLEDWVQNYVITAPETGKVLFVSFLQKNQLISLNQELFYIEPHETDYYAEMIAGQRGFGKISNGQKVMIRVASYPSDEFGYLTGTVDFISNIPSYRDSFLIRIVLPEGLRTSYQKEVSFRNNLVAQGEVITEERRLFYRLWGRLYEVISR